MPRKDLRMSRRQDRDTWSVKAMRKHPNSVRVLTFYLVWSSNCWIMGEWVR